MIDIKPAGIDDLAIIRQLACEIWPSAYKDILTEQQLHYMLEKIYSISSLQRQLNVLKHQFRIVWQDETPVAFLSFSAHEDDPTIYHLNKIYVLPNEQGKDIGKQILNHVFYQIKNRGAVSLQLNVNRNNKAFYFYQKQGFKIIREEDIDIGEGYFMNDFVMEKKL
jgi:diamine N-acetyltransferase